MKIWQFLLLLGGVALIFGGGLLVFNFTVMPRLIHRKNVVLVPDLRGLVLADAVAEGRRLDLKVRESRQRPHPTIAAGVILDQDPDPDRRIRTGRMIEVVTSSGPPAAQLLDLTGLTLRQAEITLQRESFKIGRVLHLRRQGVTVPTVVYQNPAAGRIQRKGRPVDLVVAVPGPPVAFRMPDLRGTSLFLAREKIAAAGCLVAPVSYERTRDVPPNTVLAQKPPPGDRIRKGGRVELVASSR